MTRDEEKAAGWPTTDLLTEHMRAKLERDMHKGHWLSDDVADLVIGLVHEVAELANAIADGDAKAVSQEAADVANFAMFIADKMGGLR